MPSLAGYHRQVSFTFPDGFLYHSALHLVERLNLFQGLLSSLLVSAVNIFGRNHSAIR